MMKPVSTDPLHADHLERLAAARRSMPPIFVIYDHPLDFPAHYVVRVWFGLWPELEAWLTDSIEEARAYVQARGADVRMPRDARDAHVIAETWL